MVQCEVNLPVVFGAADLERGPLYMMRPSPTGVLKCTSKFESLQTDSGLNQAYPVPSNDMDVCSHLGPSNPPVQSHLAGHANSLESPA